MKVLTAAAICAALAACNSYKTTDGVTVHIVMRNSLACQDRSKLLSIMESSANGDALQSERLAVGAIEDGNCRLLRYGDKVVAEEGQEWRDLVRVRIQDAEPSYWITTRRLLQKT